MFCVVHSAQYGCVLYLKSYMPKHLNSNKCTQQRHENTALITVPGLNFPLKIVRGNCYEMWEMAF